MDKFFKLILQLIGSAVVIFLFTMGLVCVDGLIDQGGKADAALVIGRPHATRTGADPVLDHVIKLYNDGDISLIIVNDSASSLADDHESLMVAYLEKHGVDPTAIAQDHSGENVGLAARQAVSIVKSRELKSVIIIADYYRITRMKLAVYHEGISVICKSHVGAFKGDDVVDIGREVFNLYDYMARVFVLPAAEKVKDEAQVEIDKAKVDAAKTKEKATHSLDSLPK